jgi:hypothetical protein
MQAKLNYSFQHIFEMIMSDMLRMPVVLPPISSAVCASSLRQITLMFPNAKSLLTLSADKFDLIPCNIFTSSFSLQSMRL